MTCGGGGRGGSIFFLLLIRGPYSAGAAALRHLLSVSHPPTELSEPDQTRRRHPQRACLEIHRRVLNEIDAIKQFPGVAKECFNFRGVARC